MKLHIVAALGTCLASGLLAAQTPAAGDAGTAAKTEAKATGAAAAPAAAAAAPAGVRADSPCVQDIEALCPNIQAGGGRIYRCLAEKEQELSRSCRKRLTELRSTGGECKDDIDKYCADAPLAQGRLAKCLSEHLDQLSEGCRALWPGAKATPATAVVPAAATAPAAAPAAAAAGETAKPPDAGAAATDAGAR